MDVWLYDTTLRDGAQREGLAFSLDDKLRIFDLLDDFGIPYIEGGFPSSNPKDAEFFRRARPRSARLVAFGATRRAGVSAETDVNLRALVAAETSAVAMVGKTSPSHVKHVLGASLEENLAMIAESVAFAKQRGREVIFDAEHFFDAMREDRSYALAAVRAAAQGGADWIALCDTNGGSLPKWVSSVVSEARAALLAVSKDCRIGVHTHNDSELAVANSVAGVEAGASMVQGTINGWGERCGNANLVSLVPLLTLKLRKSCVDERALSRLTELSRRASEIANIAPDAFAPYVGAAAFAHKAGLHAAAAARLEGAYEHVSPEVVGNVQRILVSELAGRGNLRARARALGLDVADHEAAVLARVKEMESKGFQLEAADGTLELVIRRAQLGYTAPFTLVDVLAISQTGGPGGMSATAKVTVRVHADDVSTEGEGKGPVDALDRALRLALVGRFAELERLRLVDYKVRILDPDRATAATTRVLLEAAHGDARWVTVGCSENIIEASCQALLDSYELCVLRERSPRVATEAAS
ncbi:MAG: citramalate synthase [Myxococcota bacterium]|nr:citramalate synthase [Myxococcota bacterium]